MRIPLLLVCASLHVFAGQTWKNDDLGLELTFPDDWTITEGSGYREYGMPLIDPDVKPTIVMLAQAPTGDMELADGVLQCVQIEICEDTFGSYGSLASKIEENSRDIAFIGIQQPKVKDCKVSEAQIGGVACVKCSVLAYRSFSYLNHIIYGVRLSNKKVVFVNCLWRDGQGAFASDFDPIVATVKCTKAVPPLPIVAIGVGLGVGGLLLVLLILGVSKLRRAGEAVPPPQPFPFPTAPPPPPAPPQTP